MRRERNAKNSQATLVLWKWCCDFAEDVLHINFYLFSSPKMKRRKKLTNASQFIFSPILPPSLSLRSTSHPTTFISSLHAEHVCTYVCEIVFKKKKMKKNGAHTRCAIWLFVAYVCVRAWEKERNWNKIPTERDRQRHRERERNENAFILMRGHQIGNRVTCIHFGCGWL